MAKSIAARSRAASPRNSVDDIPNCDFFFGSVVSRGDLQIAISTAGESPALAQRLRREIDEQLPQDLGPWLAQLGELRREVLATHPRGEERSLLLHELARAPNLRLGLVRDETVGAHGKGRQRARLQAPSIWSALGRAIPSCLRSRRCG